MTDDYHPSHISIRFVEEGVAGRARLRWEHAPAICRAIVDASPMTVRAHHAIYSGSEIAAITPDLEQLDPVSPTSKVDIGDLAYVYLFAADHDDFEHDFAEICWFYDAATPSMQSGPVDVSIFAHFEDAEQFFAVCRRMRLEGAKMIELTRS